MDGWVESPTWKARGRCSSMRRRKTSTRSRRRRRQPNQNQPLGNPQQSLEECLKGWRTATVYVSTSPAELLVTEGEPDGRDPRHQPVLRARIPAATSSSIRLTRLTTCCSPAAGSPPRPCRTATGAMLPARACRRTSPRFPLYSPKADVLVSVPGTPQAKEAVIANSIPQTATITRTAAKLNVEL